MDSEKIKEQLKEITNGILEEGIQNNNNLEHIYKIVDIEKDLCEIEEAKEKMRYGRYEGSYGRDSYGRGSYNNYNENYNEYGRERYGRRGYDTKYRGEESLNEMYDQYDRYMENRERYGASEETDKSFHYMLEAYKDFTKVLFEEAQTPQQKQMLREAIQQSMM